MAGQSWERLGKERSRQLLKWLESVWRALNRPKGESEVSPPIFSPAPGLLYFPAYGGRAVMEATLRAAATQEQGCALPAGTADCQVLRDGTCCSTDLPSAEGQENENTKGFSHGWAHVCCWPSQGTWWHQGLRAALPSQVLGHHSYAWADVSPILQVSSPSTLCGAASLHFSIWCIPCAWEVARHIILGTFGKSSSI